MKTTDLKPYLGVKIISARPLSRGEYNKFRGWTIPENENPTDEGYLVVYPDGYVSWSPEKQFVEAYISTTKLTFGLAIEALKMGKCITRDGWNGKDLFVCKQVPAVISAYVVPNMQSLPQFAKDQIYPQGISYRNQMLLIKKGINEDSIADSWVPSSSGVFAEDWRILED